MPITKPNSMSDRIPTGNSRAVAGGTMMEPGHDSNEEEEAHKKSETNLRER